MTTTDRDAFPAGGCVLTDKTRCTLPYGACCDHGRATRWPRCNCPLGCNAPTQQSPAECPFHARPATEHTEETH